MRNRRWQLRCCRFLRGQRRLGLQPWFPIPVETGAPPAYRYEKSIHTGKKSKGYAL
jgi:hypothetical protein